MTFPRLSNGLAAAFALSVFLLAACSGFNDPVDLRPVDAPRVAYDSVITFTAGAYAERPAVSTGGPVFTWSVSPALPSGLSLNAAGAVRGLAFDADTGKRYVVTAHGPGGSGTANFIVRVLAETTNPSVARPNIAYASPAHDTVGKAVSRASTSTGGPVTGYAVSPALPPGLSLDPASGLVSGTPATAWGTDHYAVIAFGPGGRDTATLVLAVYARAAEGGAGDARQAVTLRFHAAKVENSGPILTKPGALPGNLLPSVTLKRMLLVFKSSAGDTLRDTIAAGSQGLPLKIDTTRAFLKEYALPALRTWRLSVKVLDARDSVIFSDSTGPFAVSLAGVAQNTMDLYARFTGFRSTYFFPDSISRASDGKKWPLEIKSLVLQVAGVKVVDTSAPSPGFKQEVFLEYPYLVAGRTYALTQSAFGSVAGRADTLLFQGSGAYEPRREASSMQMNYVGPTDLADLADLE